MQRCSIHGQWVSGPEVQTSATVFDVRAGLLYTRTPEGDVISGLPQHFRSDGGQMGEALLDLLLVAPTRTTLLHGARRESLAAAHYTARFGHGETRHWDNCSDGGWLYIADDSSGNVGVILFGDQYVTAVVSDHEAPTVDIASAVATAPQSQARTILGLRDIPLLRTLPVTACLWSVADACVGNTTWPSMYCNGLELFKREALANDDWIEEACAHYGMDRCVAETIVETVSNSIRGDSVILHSLAIHKLLDPMDKGDVVEMLTKNGPFEIG